LDISGNRITAVGLADITRLFELTQLKSITLYGNPGLFHDKAATEHFVSTLQYKKSRVQELPWIDTTSYASINNSLTRNQQLNRVNLLLAPPTPHQRNDTTSSLIPMLKTWHRAIAKFAMVPDSAGASAIFKLFQARPALLEKRLKRPADGATADSSHGQKRRRL
jgi:hypothetical protein